MYLDTPVRIRIASMLTEMFLANMGVRQGCLHSFAIYIQELHDMLSKNTDIDTPTLLNVMIFLMLFADDIALLSYIVRGLNHQL